MSEARVMLIDVNLKTCKVFGCMMENKVKGSMNTAIPYGASENENEITCFPERYHSLV